jgi:hypothetical protein
MALTPGSSAVPVITGFGYRPGRSGHRPPQVSWAMAMNVPALWKAPGAGREGGRRTP